MISLQQSKREDQRQFSEYCRPFVHIFARAVWNTEVVVFSLEKPVSPQASLASPVT